MSTQRSLSSIELEKAVLGGIIRSPDVAAAIEGGLDVECFSAERHRVILGAIHALWAEDVTPDLISVSEELRQRGSIAAAGGAAYVSALTDVGVLASQVNWHLGKLRELTLARRLAAVAKDVSHRLYNTSEEPREILGALQDAVTALSASAAVGQWKRVGEAIDEVMEQARRTHADRSPVLGIPTGLRDLDWITGGMGAEVIVLAARPGAGKSALVMTIADNLSAKGVPVGVFSLEMSRDENVQRLLAQSARVSIHGLRCGILSHADFAKVETAAEKHRSTPIYLAENAAGMSPDDIMSAAMVAVRRHKIGLLVLDYLQLVPSKGESRREAVEMTSRTMARIAHSLKVPLIAISSLNRECEKRLPPIPTAADLRESGTIEFDADMIWLLYRPERYAAPDAPAAVRRPGEVDLFVEKHRNGPTGKLTLRFDAASTRFENHAEPNGELDTERRSNGGDGARKEMF